MNAAEILQFAADGAQQPVGDILLRTLIGLVFIMLLLFLGTVLTTKIGEWARKKNIGIAKLPEQSEELLPADEAEDNDETK